jgi:RNA polymerase sigma factor (sigma-70 family)
VDVKTDDPDSEIELWLSYRDGDKDAFTRLYREHAKTVAKYAWAILGNAVAVEEVLQETFLIAWEKRRSSRLTDESVLPWLLVVCRNASRNHRRKTSKRRVEGQLLGELADTGAPLGGWELTWIEAEISRLSPIDAQLCRLCLIEGYSYSEAADILDTSGAAVAKRLQRARAKLRASLEAQN